MAAAKTAVKDPAKHRNCTSTPSSVVFPIKTRRWNRCRRKGVASRKVTPFFVPIPLSKNFGSTAKANADNGTCVYARDKFIGTYSASEDCPSGQYTWAMAIETLADDVTQVFTRSIGDFNQNFPATIEGDKMTFDYEGTASGTLVKIDGTGTLDADGKTLRINYHVEIPSFNFAEDCEVVAIKQ